MLIAIIGESCAGKSTLAEKLKVRLGAEVYTGKDYLRLGKSEPEARQAFQTLLREAVDGGPIIYVISEKEHLALLPEGTVRVLMTAELDTIKERFAARTRGKLPAPVAAMLEKKHGCFDMEPCDIHLFSDRTDLDAVCDRLAAWGKTQEHHSI